MRKKIFCSTISIIKKKTNFVLLTKSYYKHQYMVRKGYYNQELSHSIN